MCFTTNKNRKILSGKGGNEKRMIEHQQYHKTTSMKVEDIGIDIERC
jgi:hypothetical protein